MSKWHTIPGLWTELEAVLFREPVQAMSEPPAKRPKVSANDVKKLLREDSDRVKLVLREEGRSSGKVLCRACDMSTGKMQCLLRVY